MLKLNNTKLKVNIINPNKVVKEYVFMIFLFIIHQADNNIRYINVHIDHCNSGDIELAEILPDHIKKLPQEAIKIPKNNV